MLLDCEQVGGALAVCDGDGRVVAGSPSGRALLARMGQPLDRLPAPLLHGLWELLAASPVGEAVGWRSFGDSELVLGCTRYPLGSDNWLLMMSEISQKQSALAHRLHRQRLEALGRLVATTAHDLRSPLASIVFNSDVLATRSDELSPARTREIVSDLQEAARQLRGTIDCLVDYVRLGPPLPTDVSLRDVLERMQSLLRPQLRAGGHRLTAETSAEADRVTGNPLSVEQIFVNLVLNAFESSPDHPVTVRVTSRLEGTFVRVLVEDDGAGIRPEHRMHLFDPFFTTKRDGTGLGLSSAREAARAVGGDLQLVSWTSGASFAVLLPRGSAEGES